MMSWKGKGLLGLAVIGVLLSCSTIDCPVNSLVETKYEFYSSTGETLTLLDTLTVVTARQDGIDTVFNKGSNISSFSLPISYYHPEDVFVFRFKGDGWQTADTVWIKKEDYPHFESVDCNPLFYHDLTAVKCTHNLLDSIVIKNPSVTNDNQVVHLYIYPKTGD
jgi:hypothetical protein